MYKQYDTPKRYNIENSIYDAELLKNITTGKPHWHSHFLLSIFKRNSGTQVLNNKEYSFKPGVATLIGPFDFHYNIIKDEESFDVYSIKFSHVLFSEKICEICNLENLPIVCELSEDDFKLAENLCDALIAERSKENLLGHEMFIQNIVEQLVILVMRNSKKHILPTNHSLNIRKALLYIHENFKNDITVEKVADICHYTPNYFSSCFKKETGITFRNYLLNLRLDFSYNLIRYGKKNCTEACFESGFNSIEHFSYAFKQKYGCSPRHCK